MLVPIIFIEKVYPPKFFQILIGFWDKPLETTGESGYNEVYVLDAVLVFFCKFATHIYTLPSKFVQRVPIIKIKSPSLYIGRNLESNHTYQDEDDLLSIPIPEIVRIFGSTNKII